LSGSRRCAADPPHVHTPPPRSPPAVLALNRRTSLRPLAALLALAVTLSALPLPASAAPFTTDGSWGPRVTVPFDPFHFSASAHMAANRTGGVLAVGYQYINDSANLYALTYALSSGWSEPVLLNETGLNAWAEPSVSLADDGGAVVGWVFDPPDNGSVEVSLFAPGAGWSGPTSLSAPGSGSFGIAVAMGEGGKAAAAWSENVSGTFEVRYSLYTQGSGWSDAAALDPSLTGDGNAGALQAGPNGTFVAAWMGGFLNGTAIRFSRYAPASGWTPAVNISAAPDSWYALDPLLRSLQDGTVFVAWVETDLVYQNISARRYTPAGGWGPIRAVTTSGFASSRSAMALDPGGNATVGWVEGDTNGSAVRVARYEVGAGWGPSTRLGYTDLSYSEVALCAGDTGSVTAVWQFPNYYGEQGVYARFVPARGWGSVEPIPNTPYTLGGSCVGLPGGLALFLHSSGTWSYLFTPFDLTPPPLSLTGPASDAVFEHPVVEVTGTTEPGAGVTVNGIGAAVAGNGSWTARVALAPGANNLSVVATDPWGNHATTNRTVVFNDPLPGLEADLAQAQANATAAASALADAQANLTAQNARLAALESQINSRVTEEQRLQAEISALNQSITNTRTPPAAASDGLALMIAVLGVVMGTAGIAVAVRARRGGRPPPPADPSKPQP
jgi:hypothetical protein